MKFVRFLATSLVTTCLLVATGGAVSSHGHEKGSGSGMGATLGGTTWCAPNLHQRVAVDLNGTVSTKEGKDVCLQITQSSAEGAFVIKVIWWNVEAGIHVEEWAVALSMGNGTFEYREATHPAEAGFPGIVGTGELRLTDKENMEMHQIGYLADGSAAAFQTTLKKVRALPVIPLMRTYPKP